MKYIEFQYRDGGNYKWNFIVAFSNEKFEELEQKYKTISEGTEIFYDSDLGITQDDFHEKRGYKYDDEIDHNILEVMNIIDELPKDDFEKWTIE